MFLLSKSKKSRMSTDQTKNKPSQSLIAPFLKKSLEGITPSWKKIIFSPDLKKSLNQVLVKMDIDLRGKGVTQEDILKNKIDTYLRPHFMNIFKAFKMFDAEDTKVIIMGQDPYPDPTCASGLSFSVPTGIKIPPSLINIYKCLQKSKLIKEMPNTGNLESWAKQGVLLLNTYLTRTPLIIKNVYYDEDEKREISSTYINGNGKSDDDCMHRFWKDFTVGFLEYFSKEYVPKLMTKSNHTIYALLWGTPAQDLEEHLKVPDNAKNNKIVVLKHGHPSPLNKANSNPSSPTNFINCDHFLQVDKTWKIQWNPDIKPVDSEPLGLEGSEKIKENKEETKKEIKETQKEVKSEPKEEPKTETKELKPKEVKEEPEAKEPKEIKKEPKSEPKESKSKESKEEPKELKSEIKEPKPKEPEAKKIIEEIKEKPKEIKEKPKEIKEKPKEIKEKPKEVKEESKEVKEEPKEVKEEPKPKELKEEPKELKEPKSKEEPKSETKESKPKEPEAKSKHLKVKIFVDGSCLNNGKPNAKASYSAYFPKQEITGNKEIGLYGIVPACTLKYDPTCPSIIKTNTTRPVTNNRGELLGMIKAIEYVRNNYEKYKKDEPPEIEIVADSQYTAELVGGKLWELAKNKPMLLKRPNVDLLVVLCKYLHLLADCISLSKEESKFEDSYDVLIKSEILKVTHQKAHLGGNDKQKKDVNCRGNEAADSLCSLAIKNDIKFGGEIDMDEYEF